MNLSPGFLRFAAGCAVLSAATTLCVHLIPGAEVAVTFDQQVALHSNTIYLARLWIVLFHILIVIVSLWGVAAARTGAGVGGWLGLGFAAYLLFGWAELFRTAMALFALNHGWRSRYADDSAVRDTLRPLLAGWPDLNAALFFLLILGFCLGNLFYGISFLTARERDRLECGLGFALLVWSFSGMATLLHGYTALRWVPELPDWWSWTFQPFVRVLLGLWLWREARVVSTLGSRR
jgi:hypothetical protein